MNDACDLMLSVYRSPSRAPRLAGLPLPRRIHDVIRVVGGDTDAIAEARHWTGFDDDELHEAAVLLLHHLLFFDTADHYRVLGVEPHASDECIKRHYRSLMRWLHPDRDPDNLHSVFAERVNRAWSALRTPQRRADYDSTRPVAETAAAGFAGAHAPAAVEPLPLDRWTRAAPQPWLSGRVVSRLPQLIAAAGGLTVVLLLALIFWLRGHEIARPSPAPRAGIATASPGAPPRTQPAAPPADAVPPATIAAPLPPPADTGVVEAATAALLSASSAAAAASTPTPPSPPPAMVGAARTERAEAPPAAVRVASRTAVPAARRDAASAAPRTAVAAPASLSDGDIGAFVGRFETLYAGRDVESFLALFSSDARGNDGGGLAELRTDYRRLFSTYARRELRLSQMRWQIDGDASVEPDGRDTTRTHGQILLGLRRSAEGIRVTELRHSVGR